MSKHRQARPSARELEILAMLWDRGPLTLAEAHQCFEHFGQRVGYTTLQTRLNRLVEKKLLIKDKGRPAKYRAAVTSDDVGAHHLDLLLDKLRGDSVVPLVAHLISGRRLKPDEIRELKQLIAQAEKGNQERRKAGEK
jgi:BlaI family penicillinase repressor